MSEHERQVTSIFHSAIEREGTERRAFLDGACAEDSELRREVEQLIESHERAGSFIEKPAYERGADLLVDVDGDGELLDGRSFGRYEILARVGAGGMGQVYLARDTQLGRRVALKLLSRRLVGNPEHLARFRQEAQAASALNHPNIVTIYEVGEEDGRHFIAAEYVEGVTLRALMAGAPAGLSATLDIACQIAAALAAAHEAGIVHRDVKPENVMIRRDRLVKVLDFGLARPMPTFTPAPDGKAPALLVNTSPGIVMGTVSYMSPEQARGAGVDERADVWSLGVVLYEMMTGRAPFEGETPADVLASILKTEPVPLTRLNRAVPAELERVVSKALSADRDSRYRTAGKMLTDLVSLRQRLASDSENGGAPGAARAAGSGQPVAAQPASSAEHIIVSLSRHHRGALISAAALILMLLFVIVGARYFGGPDGGAVNSLAVLPFDNVGGDAEAEYLSDGVTESLINSLSQLPRLRVIARGTAFRYKGRTVDTRVVGAELNVDAILTGRVTRRGDGLSIQVELVKVSDASQLWGQRYERRLADLPALQAELSRAVSEKLWARRVGEEQRRASQRQTESAEAYQLYLKGRYNWNKTSEDGLLKSIAFFRQAIAVDPDYALAYVGLADAYTSLDWYGVLSTRQSNPQAIAAAENALRIDDNLAEAHASLALAKVYAWDWPGAEREFKRAIELNQNYAAAHQWYGVYLTNMGRFEEAVVEMARAEELDPASPAIGAQKVLVLHCARRFAEATAQGLKALEMEPGNAEARFYLAWNYVAEGKFDEAIAEYRWLIAADPSSPDFKAMLGHAYALVGRREQARAILAELNRPGKRRHIPLFWVAHIQLGLGDNEAALALLEKAYEDPDDSFVGIKVFPLLDPLRTEPRLAELLRRMNLAP